ncbi:MAG: DNA polymerase III subunit alpha, partial [Gemmatimonadetes bacterium]|nr:DNA polymerase III subunit alpha [Gemmatimonadota bacterium]
DVYVRRKLGQEPVRYPHPDLEMTLEPTYGVIVYQEQVMRIANVLAGFSLAEADVLRKAVGKKIQELIEKELGTFVTRAVERGVNKKIAEDLAQQIETFGRYGFNKSHAAAYSLISYQTAWLKAHYPAEFMAALLSSVLDKTDDVVTYIGECRALPKSVERLEEPVQVLPPDVNQSRWKFTVVDPTRIRFGLGAVKGVGSAAVDSILKARTDGPFKSLFDFLERVELRALGKRATEALICAGALDAFGHRAQLLAGLDTAFAEVQARQAEEAAGQASLFGGEAAVARHAPPLPRVPEWQEPVRLAREKETLGFFISGHPLERLRDVVEAFGSTRTSDLKERGGQPVDLAGVVTSVARQISRRDNSEWGKVTLEDFHGSATILAFKDAWEGHKALLQQDALVLISGKVSGRERDEEDPPVFLDSALLLDDLTDSERLAVQIELDFEASRPPDIARVREVLARHPGKAPVEFRVGQDNGRPAPRLRSRSLCVRPDIDTLNELRALLGDRRVRLIRR